MKDLWTGQAPVPADDIIPSPLLSPDPVLIVFSANRRLDVTRHRIRQLLEPMPEGSGPPGAPTGYVTSMFDYIDIGKHIAPTYGSEALRLLDEDTVLTAADAPLELGASNRGEVARHEARLSGRSLPMPFRPLEDQLPALAATGAPRLAIINGFGTGIGDYVVGLTAWRVVRDRMLARGLSDVRAEIWARPHAMPRASVACPSEPSISALRALPVELGAFMALDGYWDLSGMLHRPSFGHMPTVDFFLSSLGIEPASVPADRKRNRVLVPETVQAEVDAALTALGRPFLLIHPASSTPLRDMPIPVLQRFLDVLRRRTDLPIGSLHRLPLPAGQYADLSPLFRSHPHFCAVIRRAAGLLTIDTSTYHIADAFDVPTLVIFTTVPPERWTPYYPKVEGVMLDGVRESPYCGLHQTRDPAILADMQRFWARLDVEALVDRFLGQLGAGAED